MRRWAFTTARWEHCRSTRNDAVAAGSRPLNRTDSRPAAAIYRCRAHRRSEVTSVGEMRLSPRWPSQVVAIGGLRGAVVISYRRRWVSGGHRGGGRPGRDPTGRGRRERRDQALWARADPEVLLPRGVGRLSPRLSRGKRPSLTGGRAQSVRAVELVRRRSIREHRLPSPRGYPRGVPRRPPGGAQRPPSTPPWSRPPSRPPLRLLLS
jgi:hypothetical protein